MLYHNIKDTTGTGVIAALQCDNSKQTGTPTADIKTTMTEATAEQKKSQELEIIETRFGPVEISRSNPIVFERGLLGVPDSQNFVLVNFPSENLQQFKLLQSLDKDELSFITLPLDLDNSIIARADIEKACEDVNIPVDDVAILTIVSVHRSPDKVTLSINARAPLLINVRNRQALQYVFQHSRYQVQQMLNLGDS